MDTLQPVASEQDERMDLEEAGMDVAKQVHWR